MSEIQQFHFTNGLIFTGDEWHTQVAITVEEGRITEIDPHPPGATGRVPPVGWMDLQGGYLVPAFIDVQLYGGNGQLFGVRPSVEAIQATVDYSRKGGAHLILPTVATNDNSIALAAIDAVKKYWQIGGSGVYGVHLEGPFLNPLKRGAHVLEKIQQPSMEALKALVEPGRGIIKMMTIAPELFQPDQIDYLLEAGIILSAGHSNASFEEANTGFDRGISTCTHLFNAMSPLQHRAPGLVGAIFSHPSVASSIVPDGYHVDPAVIKMAKHQMGERLFIITDAVTENQTGNYLHQLRGDHYTLPDGTLSGSALTMLSAVQFCVKKAEISLVEALRMASLYPARVLGIDKEWGKLAVGYRPEWFWIPSF
ncbi:N-acetylglucosamine-6-phosphate deacetylase [Flavihumibacter sp. UBA7668]|uniref:N-acetylglucosamine-6-phosphate deacetylase n=1 Tax=Flavihumibacter sp. UBA7668 TaxID=1946542 RepID=UPI0025C54929|nr:N-acetylglucosamine-6-phosphate deacetylase [Flavihumibacter sp. UBA7668]